jgi:hypothetical protein
MSEKCISGPFKEPVRCFEATSLEADFDKLTWTFQIDADTQVAAGQYLLIHQSDLMEAVNGTRYKAHVKMEREAHAQDSHK